jgi:hypothetical protein
MKNAAFKVGEKINWYTTPGNRETEVGIIKGQHRWGPSYCYLIEDKTPHLWIQEEQIVGYEDRRNLRDKLDGMK